MFDIGWSELVVIGVVALIAIGPKELPGTLRALGHYMGKVRRMASEFQDQFREAMREAEVADLKRQFDEASEKATSVFNNPLETVQKEMESAFAEADPTKELAKESSKEPEAAKESTTEPAKEPIMEPAKEPTTELVREPVPEPVAPPAKEEVALTASEPQADSKAGGGA